MKVFIFAVAALISSTLIVVFSLLYILQTLNTTNDLLSALPDIMEENADKKTSENILGCLEKAMEHWTDKSKILSLFISHKDLDEAEALMVTLKSSVEAKDSGHYASTLATLKEKIKKLSASEKISLSSIL